MEEMSENHEESLMEMETAHNDTLATLQEEHARTVKSEHHQPDRQYFNCERQKTTENPGMATHGCAAPKSPLCGCYSTFHTHAPPGC